MLVTFTQEGPDGRHNNPWPGVSLSRAEQTLEDADRQNPSWKKPAMQRYEPNLSLTGRLLLAALFLWAAFHKVFNPEGTLQYMTAYGLTTGTMLLYLAATVVEFAGGIALALGHTTRETVLLLILFMLMVTGIFHTDLTDPNQVIQFVKNVAIIGSLLYVGAYGPGSLSMDAQPGASGKGAITEFSHPAVSLAARILIGGLFFVSAMNAIFDTEGARRYRAEMGTVHETALLYAGGVLLETAGLLSLLLGWRARAGAAALIIFLIAVTIMFHRTSMSFVLDATIQDQQFHLMKNLAIMGGLTYVLAYGPGPISLDARRSRKR